MVLVELFYAAAGLLTLFTRSNTLGMDLFDIGYVSKCCIQLTLVHQWMDKFPNNYLSFSWFLYIFKLFRVEQ